MSGCAGHSVGDVFLGLNDFIHLLVNGLVAEEVIAVHRVLLAVTVGAVLGLLTVAVSPGELDKAYAAGGCQGQARTAGTIVEDNELAVGVVLELVNGGLLLSGILATRYADGIGKFLFESCHYIFQESEHDQLLAAVYDVVNKIRHGLDFAVSCYLFEDADLHHHLTSHGSHQLVIRGVLILPQIAEQVLLRICVLLAVCDVAGDILARLVGELGENLLLFPAKETTHPQTVVQLTQIGRLLGSVAEASHKLLIAAEVLKTVKNFKLLHKVGIVVDNRGAGQLKYPPLTLADALDILCLLGLAAFALVALVYDDALKEIDALVKMNGAESDTLGGRDFRDEKLFKALVVGDEHRADRLSVRSLQLVKTVPVGFVVVIENDCINTGELLKLALPVDF